MVVMVSLVVGEEIDSSTCRSLGEEMNGDWKRILLSSQLTLHTHCNRRGTVSNSPKID